MPFGLMFSHLGLVFEVDIDVFSNAKPLLRLS